MKKLLIILAVIGALAGFGIYKLVNTFTKASELGEEAVAFFHSEYNANRAGAIHAAAAPAFQKDVSVEQWNQLHALLHEKLGAWKSGEQSGIHVETKNGNETLKVSFTSEFEKGKGSEEFVFDYNGDKPLLLGYEVNSDALKAPAAPSAPQPGLKAGERGGEAVASFHTDYNAKRARAIHAAAAPAFQRDVSMDQWNELHALLHEKLGAWKSGEQSGSNVETKNGKETLSVSFTSVFEKGKGTEEFVFDNNGDKPLLLGYNVKSDALKQPAPPAENP